MRKMKILLLTLILALSCSMNVYATDWVKSPIKSDVEGKQWDKNGDGVIDEREAAIRDAMEQRGDTHDELGSDEAINTITSNKAASALNTVCYIAGICLLVSSVSISVLYLAEYVTDGKYCILSFITKKRLIYEDMKAIPFLCKMLFSSVLGIFIANGTFQRWLHNLYAYIYELI